jgi:hypothetical protein
MRAWITYYLYGPDGRRKFRAVTDCPRFLSSYRTTESYYDRTLTKVTRIWGGAALTFSDGHTLFVTMDDYAPGVYPRR